MIENFCKIIKKTFCMDRADLKLLQKGYEIFAKNIAVKFRFENLVKFLLLNFRKFLQGFAKFPRNYFRDIDICLLFTGETACGGVSG